MRITGGKLKGRVTETPYGKMAIRPAMDRMRESIFDIIGPDLDGKSFLDLFSGSGTIAIEAVSHGATKVSLCEMDKSKAKTVFKNVAMTEEVGVRIECHFMAVELFLKRVKGPFDYIFLDPPFPYKFRKNLLETISRRNLLSENGKVLIHYPAEDPLPEDVENLHMTDQRIYGRSIVNFYQPNQYEKLDKIEMADENIATSSDENI